MDENDDVIIISSSKPRNCVSELYDCINVWNVHDHPKYDNMGCQSSKGGMQNLDIVFGQISTLLKGNSAFKVKFLYKEPSDFFLN